MCSSFTLYFQFSILNIKIYIMYLTNFVNQCKFILSSHILFKLVSLLCFVACCHFPYHQIQVNHWPLVRALCCYYYFHYNNFYYCFHQNCQNRNHFGGCGFVAATYFYSLAQICRDPQSIHLIKDHCI